MQKKQHFKKSILEWTTTGTKADQAGWIFLAWFLAKQGKTKF